MCGRRGFKNGALCEKMHKLLQLFSIGFTAMQLTDAFT